MAAIASTRIASGGGVYHKPQTNDANSASGTDASSPFQQILSTTAAGSSAVPPAQDQGTSNQQDSGKKSGKDPKVDGNAGQSTANQSKTDQAQQNAVVAAVDSKTLIQASAANDDSQDNTDAIDTSSNSTAATGQDSDTTAGQASDPSPQQAAANAIQALAASQISVPVQSAQDANNSGNDANEGSGNDGGNAGATLLDSVNKSTAPSQTASADDAAAASASVLNKSAGGTQTAPADNAATSAVSGADASSDTSKSGKAKRDSQDAAAAQIQTQDASAPVASATQSPAPVAKKDTKSTKTGDQGNSNIANVQTAPPDSTIVVAMAASAAPLQTAPVSASATDSGASDAIAAAAVGQAKSGQTKSTSNPLADAKTQPSNNQVPGGQASGGAANSPSANGAQSSPAGVTNASQDGSSTQGNDASQGAGSKPPASDKSDTASAPAQPQIQAAQPQPQPSALPAIQSQQAHAGATDSVTQNVQVSQPDSNSTANTVGALAVAIAARSQSGNKQFDIRLDPPELGRVEVRLSIDTTGKVQASLSADQPRTLDLLKTDAPALTRALRDAGLNVAQNGLNFSLRGQNQQNAGGSSTPRSGRAPQSLIATSAIGAVQGGAHYQGPADGRLDIRV